MDMEEVQVGLLFDRAGRKIYLFKNVSLATVDKQ